MVTTRDRNGPVSDVDPERWLLLLAATVGHKGGTKYVREKTVQIGP